MLALSGLVVSVRRQSSVPYGRFPFCTFKRRNFPWVHSLAGFQILWTNFGLCNLPSARPMGWHYHINCPFCLHSQVGCFYMLYATRSLRSYVCLFGGHLDQHPSLHNKLLDIVHESRSNYWCKLYTSVPQRMSLHPQDLGKLTKCVGYWSPCHHQRSRCIERHLLCFSSSYSLNPPWPEYSFFRPMMLIHFCFQTVALWCSVYGTTILYCKGFHPRSLHNQSFCGDWRGRRCSITPCFPDERSHTFGFWVINIFWAVAYTFEVEFAFNTLFFYDLLVFSSALVLGYASPYLGAVATDMYAHYAIAKCTLV